MSLFGKQRIPLRLSEGTVGLTVEKRDGIFVYERKCREDIVKKVLLSKSLRVEINPVEPLNTPKELTPHLLVEFSRELQIEPGGSRKVYITCPVEIGVFVYAGQNEKEFRDIDIFSVAGQKYSLYGDVRQGVLCKYWKSDLHISIPAVKCLEEGVIEFNVSNKTGNWVKVTKAVFNAYQMKIYYNSDMVCMKANMGITGKDVAETNFEDSPLMKGMTKSLELFKTRKFPGIAAGYVMEWGL